MKFYSLIFTLISLLSSFVACAADINVDYTYSGTAYDLSGMKKGPLQITVFSDARGLDNPRLLAAGGDQLEAPVTEIIHSALQQAFLANGAILASTDAPLILSGELIELTVTRTDAQVQIQARARAMLKDSNRTRWETVLFSRGSGASAEEAMRSMLGRLAQELLIDDYFLLELI
ncbi:MAG: LPS assembly lipoprotein LptE [Pseudomonadales bacterium]|nr:LPS assembly lipoprotein LptE [Pseudomonadales bacterium]